jgi:hypothetical protein
VGTRETIFEALAFAVENGYDLKTWSVGDIILDLQAYCEDCQDMGDAELRPHVEEWLNAPRS